MFCYQPRFDLATQVVTCKEEFGAIVDSPRTHLLVKEAREALARGDKATYDTKKKQLPLMVFPGTFEESVKKLKDGTELSGRWRSQAHVHLNGLVVADYDHMEGDVRTVWQNAYEHLSDADKARLMLVFVTPSGEGLKVVFTADKEVGNLIDNQLDFSTKLGMKVDQSCKDGCRGAFMTTRDDILFIDEERLFTYEDKTFGEKWDAEYRKGNSKPSTSNATPATVTPTSSTLNPSLATLTYHNIPYQKIVEAWLDGMTVEPGDRHRTSLWLADHLRYITDNDAVLIEQLLRGVPFVQEIVAERNENVAETVKSAQGYKMYKTLPKKMREALKKAGAVHHDPLPIISAPEPDPYDVLPFDEWAKELYALASHFLCLNELFLNVHPHKMPAVWFSAAAMFGTLMTKSWYHFWYEPGIMRRLNYCVFIIGDPGAGKNIIEQFYFKIVDPMIQADQGGIDAENRYKDGRTERSTSTKAQKGDALKKPVVGIRVHPARTSTGEFIRHMLAAVANVQGQRLNLHMFSFDSELDNVTKQHKGGDWKDREVMELKAFHNEQDGQMYASQESITGMFNVYWNFIYTGTPYALHRKVNQRNFGTGIPTRLAVIPMPDKGLAQRHQKVDPHATDTLQMWAYRLDKVEGELPIEPLNDETYAWQSSRMEVADFNGDKATRTLLKRIPYYGIAVSIPFILMRHWDEWQDKHTFTMDATDRRLCRLAMDIQYSCQQFFFGEMAFNYFADQNKEFVVKRRTTRYEECYRKLPDDFKTQHFKDIFGTNDSATSRAIKRLLEEKIIKRLRWGTYRKLLQQLP